MLQSKISGMTFLHSIHYFLCIYIYRCYFCSYSHLFLLFQFNFTDAQIDSTGSEALLKTHACKTLLTPGSSPRILYYQHVSRDVIPGAAFLGLRIQNVPLRTPIRALCRFPRPFFRTRIGTNAYARIFDHIKLETLGRQSMICPLVTTLLTG